MKNVKCLLVAFALCHLEAAANTNQQKINERLNDQRVQVESHLNSSPRVEPAVQSKETQNENMVYLSEEMLLNRPELFNNLFFRELISVNVNAVRWLLSVYHKLPQNHQLPSLVHWAEAILSRGERDYSRAIQLYRQVVAKNNNLLDVRFQLAVTLFENREFEAAEDQFNKLRAERLSSDSLARIDEYLDAIHRSDRWTFGGGFTYLYDPNINNAPKAGTTYGNWTPSKAESAQGVGFNFDLGKKWSWGDGFYNELRGSSSGKYYWDNKKYNEGSVRGSLGLGFQNGLYHVALHPFMEQSFYAGGTTQSDTLKRFSKTGGVAAEMGYWISPQWFANANYEYGEQRYTSRKHLNGNLHFVSTGLNYYASAKQLWFASVNYNRTATRDRDDSFYRKGINLGWQQEWGMGLSTRLAFNAARKQYKGPMPIFGIIQRNREYGIQATIWHRAVSWAGVTPRLTYHYNKTQSNHPFYSFDKHRAFIELSRQF